MGVLIAALPGMTVALVIAAVAFLGAVAVVLVASRGRGSADPPLENQVLGDWFEPESSAEPNGDPAMSNGSATVAADAAESNRSAFASDTGGSNGWPLAAGVAAAMVAEPAAPEAGVGADAGGSVKTGALTAATIWGRTDEATSTDADAGANGGVSSPPAAAGADAFAASNGWGDAESGATLPSAEPGSSEFDETASGSEEFDYGSLERDLGFTERTGGALAVGIASVVLVVLIGLWLVASAHHGAGTPVHIVHTPIPGPPGPQGSPLP
jgi:hypothetical protein